MVSWASRTSGGIGIVTAVLYLGILLGENDPSQIPEAIAWFSVMVGTGLLAWFADRAAPTTGRRMLCVASGIFMVLGVLSLLSIGIIYLIACSLAVFSLLGGLRPVDPKGNENGR